MPPDNLTVKLPYSPKSNFALLLVIGKAIEMNLLCRSMEFERRSSIWCLRGTLNYDVLIENCLGEACGSKAEYLARN